MLHVSPKNLELCSEVASFARPVDFEDLVGPALEAAKIGIWQVNLSTALGTWNAVTSEILGLERVAQLVPAPLPVHPADREEVARRLTRNARGEGEQCVEVRILTPTGDVRWVRSTARAPRGGIGDGTWVAGVITDITGQRETQEQLREAREVAQLTAERLHVTLQTMPQMLWTHDLVSGEELYSHQFHEFTGVTLGESGGTSRLDLVHVEDREHAQKAWQHSLATGDPYESEYRLLHRDGDYRWVLGRANSERDLAGNVVAWHGTCTDIHERVLAQAELQRREQNFKQTLDLLPHSVWSVPADGARPDYYNARWYEFTGLPSGSLEGPEWQELYHANDRARVADTWAQSRATGAAYECEYRIRDRFGDYRWILSRGQREVDLNGTPRWYGTYTDIHDKVLSREALTVSEYLSRGIIEATPDCVSLLDTAGRVVSANAATLKAYGTNDPSFLLGGRWGARFGERFDRHGLQKAEQALHAAQSGKIAKLVLNATDGVCWDIVVAPVRDKLGRVMNTVVISRDVTHQRRIEEEVRWAAYHDPLTKLANRSLLQERVDSAILEAEAGGSNFALLLLDLDDFKRINDTLGHGAGDALLTAFSERLRRAARADDVIARLGGDEFAVVLMGVQSEEEVQAVITSILTELQEPCILEGRILECQASIGVSMFPNHGASRTELLKNADVALYAAKASGRGNFRIFRSEMRAELQKRESQLSVAGDALKNDRIVPFYQPKIDLISGEVVGFEALLRWRHPVNGVQHPKTLAAAFQDATLAVEISDRIIEQVIQDLQLWRDQGIDIGHVAVNASAAEFRRGDFAERLLESMQKASLPNSAIQLEVTETVFLGRGAEYVERALKMLSSEGVIIALDDFGTGYASLSHLKQFPVNIIKIDQSFVSDMTRNKGDVAIIDAVVSLGRSLDIGVVAEGVETFDQHRALVGLGCRYGQGFLYGKAAPARRVPGFLRPVSARLEAF